MEYTTLLTTQMMTGEEQPTRWDDEPDFDERI